MHAHRIETTLEQDGMLTLRDLPFQAGEAVEVIIMTQEATPSQEQSSRSRYPLRGTPVHYDQPTEPVAQDDWDAL
jgi:hypothetical protein